SWFWRNPEEARVLSRIPRIAKCRLVNPRSLQAAGGGDPSVERISAKRLAHRVGEAGGRTHGASFAIDEGVGSPAGHEQLVAPTEFVVEADANRWLLAHRCYDFDQVVIQGGTKVLHAHLEHGQPVPFGLQFAVG